MFHYTTTEVANILRMNTQTIRRKIQRGEIKAVKIGGRYLVPEEEVKRILNVK